MNRQQLRPRRRRAAVSSAAPAFRSSFSLPTSPFPRPPPFRDPSGAPDPKRRDRPNRSETAGPETPRPLGGGDSGGLGTGAGVGRAEGETPAVGPTSRAHGHKSNITVCAGEKVKEEAGSWQREFAVGLSG